MADPHIADTQRNLLAVCDCSGLSAWSATQLARPLAHWRSRRAPVQPKLEQRKWLLWAALATGVGGLIVLAWLLLTPKKTVRASLW